MAGEAVRIMQDCAEVVDTIPEGEQSTWQFFAGSGDYAQDAYTLKFLSRGSIAPVAVEDLGYLGEYITVDSRDPEGDCPRMIIYDGPSEHLPDLSWLLRDKLLLPVQDDNPLENFNGPLSLFGAVIQSSFEEEGADNGQTDH